ncbi:sensor histidine kinase [Paenibacillus sp. TRM 82003]|nr:sensor histidine kinase [Paenibacillus sp. TRM 82003]
MAYQFVKDYIINILFVFSPIVFYPYIYKLKANPRTYRSLVFLAFSFSLVTTMSFPIQQDGLVYDMRSVSLAVGTLYGGIVVGGFLFLTAILFRAFLDYPNTLLYALSILPGFLSLVLIYRAFPTVRLVKKMLLAVVGCTLLKASVFAIYLSFTGRLPLWFEQPIETLNTYLFQAIVVVVLVYVYEFLMNHYRLEEEIMKSEKANIVGSMAAAVAHEIRNPLTTVRGFIQLLGDGSIVQEKRTYYQRICLDELERAQQIISDYLTLAKPEPESWDPIDIHVEIEFLAQVLQTLANYNNTEIVSEAPERGKLYIVGDRSKFRQAMVNICKNAIEAMPDGGVLRIGAKRVDGLAKVYVADTGIGMTTEQVDRLGTPYFSTKEKGTGLGTMVTFQIIRKMSGRVDVRSKLGKGTEFELTFPAA